MKKKYLITTNFQYIGLGNDENIFLFMKIINIIRVISKPLTTFINQNILKFKRNKLALIVFLFATLIYVVFEVFSYRKFYFPVLDLGLYNRHFWSLIRLDFSANPLKGFNLLGDHAHFILIFLAPIYALYQTPMTLLLMQILAILLSGIPIYLIAKKYFKQKTIAALFLLPYYFYFGFISGLAYPFHVSVISVLPLSFALYFLLEKKYTPLMIALGILILTKEDMPLLVLMFALYLIIISRQYWLGAFTMVFAAVYVAVITNYFLPAVSGIHYRYLDTTNLGNNFVEIIKNSLSRPMLFIKTLCTPLTKVNTMLMMLKSFGFFSLAGLEILILLLPLWLGRFLSSEQWRWWHLMHYSANQGPILAVAAIVGISRIASILPFSKYKQFFLWICLLIIFTSSIYVNVYSYRQDFSTPNPLLRLIHLSFYKLNDSEKTAWRSIDMVPKDGSVGVQSAFPALTGRKDVYNLPLDPREGQPQYLLLSPNFDYWPFESGEAVESYVNNAENLGYKRIVSQDNVYLLKK